MPKLLLYKPSKEKGDVDALNEPSYLENYSTFVALPLPPITSNEMIPPNSNNSSRLHAQSLRYVGYLGEVYIE